MMKLVLLLLSALVAMAASKHIERRSMRQAPAAAVVVESPMFIMAEARKRNKVEEMYPQGAVPQAVQVLLNKQPRDYDKIFTAVKEDVDREVEQLLSSVDYTDPTFDMEALFQRLDDTYIKLQSLGDELGVKVDMTNEEAAY